MRQVLRAHDGTVCWVVRHDSPRYRSGLGSGRARIWPRAFTDRIMPQTGCRPDAMPGAASFVSLPPVPIRRPPGVVPGPAEGDGRRAYSGFARPVSALLNTNVTVRMTGLTV